MIQNDRLGERASEPARISHTHSPLENDLAEACGENSEHQGSTFTEMLGALESAHAALEPLDTSSRSRAMRMLAEVLEVELTGNSPTARPPVELNAERHDPTKKAIQPATPREFVSQKKPKSQVERVACLAYYLTHYRGTAHFKTADITALNTEAAGHKFGNASRDVDNAERQSGYIVAAGNGAKQITVRGEAVVEALPDREAVKAAQEEHPHKRKRVAASTAKKGKPEMTTDEQ